MLGFIFLVFVHFGVAFVVAASSESETGFTIGEFVDYCEDGIVYWTYLNNYSKPRSEYNIMGLAIFRGGDCENNRYVNIESQMFQGSMGSEPFGDRLKPEQEWTTPTSGQIDEKIFNFVCSFVDLGQVEAEEEIQSESNSNNGWIKVDKNSMGDKFYVDENIRKNNGYSYFIFIRFLWNFCYCCSHC